MSVVFACFQPHNEFNFKVVGPTKNRRSRERARKMAHRQTLSQPHSYRVNSAEATTSMEWSEIFHKTHRSHRVIWKEKRKIRSKMTEPNTLSVKYVSAAFSQLGVRPRRVEKCKRQKCELSTYQKRYKFRLNGAKTTTSTSRHSTQESSRPKWHTEKDAEKKLGEQKLYINYRWSCVNHEKKKTENICMSLPNDIQRNTHITHRRQVEQNGERKKKWKTENPWL